MRVALIWTKKTRSQSSIESVGTLLNRKQGRRQSILLTGPCETALSAATTDCRLEGDRCLTGKQTTGDSNNHTHSCVIPVTTATSTVFLLLRQVEEGCGGLPYMDLLFCETASEPFLLWPGGHVHRRGTGNAAFSVPAEFISRFVRRVVVRPAELELSPFFPGYFGFPVGMFRLFREKSTRRMQSSKKRQSTTFCSVTVRQPSESTFSLSGRSCQGCS